MDDDNEIFELFLSVMAQVQPEDPDGRMRVISKNPRYEVDNPAAVYPPKTYKEKR